MKHDGSDDCPSGPISERCSTIASREAGTAPHSVARRDAEQMLESRPFVAQDGQSLYLVASVARGWVVAELEFDPGTCVFALKRQTEYEWPREALGRLLSRVMSRQSSDEREMIRMSDAFTEWLATQFAA